MKQLDNYKKYRWFYTSTKKLVIGGKSALQNDELLNQLKQSGENYFVMHTLSPGSPFSVILSSISTIKQADIKETAIFTACFSRAWRACKKTAQVDIFELKDIFKTPKMKTGTWGVRQRIKRISVNLELVLAKQSGILRAVPPATPKKKEILLKIQPGKIEKNLLLSKIQVALPESFSKEELLSALPSGGFSIKK